MRVHRRARPVIERASQTDLAMLAMDTGPVPSQVGAVLLLDAGPGFDLPAAEALLADRVRAVPRLRQRLVRVPPGCGRRVWVDNADFDVGRHLRHLRCPPPGDERALLDLATAVVTDPLPRSRPLWSAAFVTGLTGNAVALVVAFHHVLADGLGGLAALLNLVDQAARPPGGGVPETPAHGCPARRRRLPVAAADAVAPARGVARRAGGHRGGGRTAPGPRRPLLPASADGTTPPAGGGPRRPSPAACGGHRHGGTVNDAVLAAVTGALHTLLERRGEAVDAAAVTVPVAGRRSASAARLGNRIAPMLVALPGTGDPRRRLE